MRTAWIPIVVATTLLFAAVACSDETSETAGDSSTPAAGVRVVTPTEAAAIQADPPPDLVILDVRTTEEFAAGHLEGATMLDFYQETFADELAALDRDQPYLLYCQSGNRSGQARQMMVDLGFADVADVEGGITAWVDAGLPVVTG